MKLPLEQSAQKISNQTTIFVFKKRFKLVFKINSNSGIIIITKIKNLKKEKKTCEDRIL